MPLTEGKPISAIPSDVRALQQYFRSMSVVPDPNSVGPVELAPEAITTEAIAGAVAAPNDRFYVKRADEMVLAAIEDTDIPATITRDAEMVAADAIVAADAASALAAHEAAADPHPGYTTAAELSAALGALNLASGTYTPTLTNVANLDGSTAFECQYLRVGSVVTVSGKVSVDPTLAATSTQLGISLPIASDLGATEDCSGAAFASGIAAQGAAILGDAANNRAQLQFISADLTNQPMYFTFQYSVI